MGEGNNNNVSSPYNFLKKGLNIMIKTIFMTTVKADNGTDKMNAYAISLDVKRIPNKTVYLMWVCPIKREVKYGVVMNTGCPMDAYRHMVAYAKRNSRKHEKMALMSMISALKGMRDTEFMLDSVSDDDFNTLLEDIKKAEREMK